VPPALAGVGPGLLASFVITAAATFLADHYAGPVMLYALLLGMAMNFLSEVERCKAGIAFAARTMLRLGVALLGFRITLWQIAALGWQPVVLVIIVVTLTIIVSIFAARRMGFNPQFGLLSGGATAICGASAAMAISAALPSHPLKERATLFTIIGVSILSTVAMILYPAISRLMGFDDLHAGIFIGATIHDVAQVVGAGFAISPEAGDTATVVKLMRVAMLLPVVLATGLFTRTQGDGTEKRPPLLPWFVTAFLALVAFNTFVPLPAFVGEFGNVASRWSLVAAIAALGVKTHFKDVIDIGWKPVMLMVLETLFIAALALIAIGGGWI
jgi:uncharacterized integral membrane protein (TIGR00698 family)